MNITGNVMLNQKDDPLEELEKETKRLLAEIEEAEKETRELNKEIHNLLGGVTLEQLFEAVKKRIAISEKEKNKTNDNCSEDYQGPKR